MLIIYYYINFTFLTINLLHILNQYMESIFKYITYYLNKRNKYKYRSLVFLAKYNKCDTR